MGPRKLSREDIIRKASGGKEPGRAGVKYSSKEKHGQMGKHEFLKLLSNQLNNQDPMNPVDQRKFSADLAQFAQLEQLTNINSKMEKSNGTEAAESKFYAASFLGKKVFTNGSTIDHNGQTPSMVNFNLDKAATGVRVRVFDKQGSMVAEMKQGPTSLGANALRWNGKRLDGYSAAKGLYKISVEAWDESFQRVEVKTQSSGIVNSVAFKNGQAILTLDNGKKVALRDVGRFEVPNMKRQAVNSAAPQQVAGRNTNRNANSGLAEY